MWGDQKKTGVARKKLGWPEKSLVARKKVGWPEKNVGWPEKNTHMRENQRKATKTGGIGNGNLKVCISRERFESATLSQI